jgi:alpha-glucosidase
VLIGEIYAPVEHMVEFYGENLDECHLPFNFHLVTEPWAARGFAAFINEYERLVPEGGWPNWVLGNHDRPRIASRVSAGQARVAAMLLLTLRGTPTMYYGDEIGMHDVSIPPDRLVDPAGKINPSMNRDPERTPMQWDATENAGFTTGEPWLPIGTEAARVNVTAQRDAPTSMLSLYRRLIWYRRSSEALRLGSYRPLDSAPDGVFAYLREAESERLLVALNFTSRPLELDVGDMAASGHLALSTDPSRPGGELDLRPIALGPDEGVIIRLA